MRSLCIITHGYPGKSNNISQPFTRDFAHAVARQGRAVTVIAPVPLHEAWGSHEPLKTVEAVEAGISINVFRPHYLSVSNRQFLRWNSAQIGLASFCTVVGHVLKHLVVPRPDALYGHFLYLGGAAAVRFGREMGIPAFPMVGDGQLNSVQPFGLARARHHFREATGFMSNSSAIARLLHDEMSVNEDRMGVFPNGINHRVFFPRDKMAMRAARGLPLDRFLVICVGHQDKQKGPCRVGEAIHGMAGVSGIFLGSGPNPPQADNIILSAPVPHAHVPDWLSAADVFVLPSTYEGSCNAALEAMACGLPVISSEGTFNDDILNPEVSIRIDPMDVEAIRAAIVRLHDNPKLRVAMGRAALGWSRRFDVDNRARAMLAFMEQHVNSFNRPASMRRY